MLWFWEERIAELEAEVERLRAALQMAQAEIERLRELKTPASRKLLNITKGCLDNAEAEVERLRVACDAAFYAMCAYRDTKDDEVFQDAIDTFGVRISQRACK